MIVSKPKSSALIALSIFTIICLGMGGYALRAILSGLGAWYHYLIASLTLLIALVLIVRQILSYKIIRLGEGRIKVQYPFRGKVKDFNISELFEWKEIVIKTKNAPYKQMELKFDNFLLKLSVQENTNYDQIKKYLKKRVAKKEEKQK
jgi:hypothetical protein